MTQNNLIKIDFEGNQITGMWWKGRPCMMARDVGRALGYGEDGKGLLRCLLDWADELLVGTDLIIVDGDELKALKKHVVGLGEDLSLSLHRVPRLALLTKSGVDMVCMKTSKPVGVRLRRQLANMDLIEYRQDAAGEMQAAVKPGRIAAAPDRMALLWERERRLSRKVDIEDRKLRLEAIREGLEHLGGSLCPEALQALRVAAMEIGAGIDIPAAKPTVEDTWLPPTEIAKLLGVSAQKVGKTITKLGLRGNIDGMARAIMNKASHSDRNVVSYLYSPTAIAKIKGQLTATPALVE